MSIETAEMRLPGPLGAGLAERPPFGPMQRLDGEQLRVEQRATLAAPQRRYWWPSRLLFGAMDVVYGAARTHDKFRVLELVARVPYQAWEQVAYVAVTHTARRPGFARRVFDTVRASRWEQDNEQWHLLLLEEMTASGSRLGVVKRTVIPQVLAAIYYQLSWFTFVVKPSWAYRLNADFEDHAEHEYARFVQEHPEFETQPFVSEFADDFGSYASVAELFRQIGFDERLHKQQSEAMLQSPRFGR
jgi:ubiquinol oxidase